MQKQSRLYIYSLRRWIERISFNCYDCNAPVSPAYDLDANDFFIFCPCGSVYDLKPVSHIRKPKPPTHKIITSIRAFDGRIMRRRTPLSDADKQLLLFGDL